MKKTGRGLALLLAGVLLAASAAGCQKQGKQDIITSENLMKNAQCVTDAGDKAADGALSVKDKGSLTITFPQETELNTVVLREKGSNILSFQIEAMVNGAFEKIYEQDKVEAYRYCAFPAVKTSQLKITVNQVRQGKQANLKSTEVYQIKNDASRQSRVTTYLIADRAYDKSTLDAGHFDTITDVILFGMTSFDENGNVIFNEAEINGKKLDGKQVFEQALKNVRELSAARKTPLKIYVNFLGPSPKDSTGDWTKDMNLKADLHKKAMVDNGEKLIKGLTDFITTYEMDGLFFDYEYPLKKAQWTVFGDFLISLKEKMGSKILGTALAAWGVSLSQKAIDSIDLVEVMSYDAFDDDGNHSPFYSCGPEAIDFFVKRGFDKSRLDLGIPFYARPSDSGGFWYDYSSEAQKLGKYGNKATGKASDEKDPCDTRYYNGYQMVYDKTAYAANAGVGGVMIWHYHCDLPSANELSLFGAMKHALEDRK